MQGQTSALAESQVLGDSWGPTDRGESPVTNISAKARRTIVSRNSQASQ